MDHGNQVDLSSPAGGAGDQLRPLPAQRINERETVEAYGRELKRLSGKKVTWAEIDGHIRAANVITSFICWHEYLHGSDEGRVREIYGKMVADSVGLC